MFSTNLYLANFLIIVGLILITFEVFIRQNFCALRHSLRENGTKTNVEFGIIQNPI